MEDRLYNNIRIFCRCPYSEERNDPERLEMNRKRIPEGNNAFCEKDQHIRPRVFHSAQARPGLSKKGITGIHSSEKDISLSQRNVISCFQKKSPLILPASAMI